MRHLNVLFKMKFAILTALMAFSYAVIAQDTTSTSVTTTTSTTETTTWYTSPWVWVVGGLVFILLLAAILRGSSNKTSSGSTDRVTVTKTVKRDTDVNP